ncbi:Do family serine endopeptidase [Aurantimonas sp. Leaf443]|uniref:Do family serine endopeptidase n=1 Tax=Aurantimonas sp. Leaf443 TaxID=1736378 RepID=UPI000701F985|nr:Do family serine endopeptidase [Aurantimonas sp. Leaf443]KQT86081.1 serine protease [Aurantimonas sp. Leaf443]
MTARLLRLILPTVLAAALPAAGLGGLALAQTVLPDAAPGQPGAAAPASPPQGQPTTPDGAPAPELLPAPPPPAPASGSGVTAGAPVVPPPPGQTQHGPESVADLAEPLLDAVVNISTSQKVEAAGRGIPKLEAPEGSPLQDFFDDLLKDEDGVGDKRVQSLGSGFVLDAAAGIVVTNNHVIADADEITVNFADGHQLDAELVGTDPKTDIAVLRVKPDRPLKAVEFGDSEHLRIGDWVMAIGNPFGLGGSVSVGIVSARGRNINAGPYDNFIQTDAAINRGNSGGPLFDMHGRVVGINTAIISPTGGSIGIGFSIPSQLAANVVGQLREFGETRRGWLGVRLQAVTEDIATGLGIGEARGAVVMGIVPEGPSDNGALKIGDVIVTFDGKPIATSRDLPRVVAETPVGKTVDVTVLRKADAKAPAAEETVQVTLGRLEDGEKLMAEKEGGEAAAADAAEPAEGATELLGMTIADVDAAQRAEFDLADDATGVVVTAVKPQSAAAEKGIEPGMIIREVAQETVSTAAEVAEKVEKLKSDGRKNALFLLAASGGDLRFIVVPVE